MTLTVITVSLTISVRHNVQFSFIVINGSLINNLIKVIGRRRWKNICSDRVVSQPSFSAA
jgi:hypothetical protein